MFCLTQRNRTVLKYTLGFASISMGICAIFLFADSQNQNHLYKKPSFIASAIALNMAALVMGYLVGKFKADTIVLTNPQYLPLPGGEAGKPSRPWCSWFQRSSRPANTTQIRLDTPRVSIGQTSV